MKFASLFGVTTLALSVVASPASNYAVHEQRNAAPAGWVKRGLVPRNAILPMSIAVKQSNIDKAYDHLMDVSHPRSKTYGKHWTAKQVAEAFAPSEDSLTTIKQWLAASGIPVERVKQSQGLDWLKFDATVEEAESLLKTEYNIYDHESGQPHIACSEYSLPRHVQDHVDFITPSVHFDAKIKPVFDKNLNRRQSNNQDPEAATNVGEPGSGSLPKLGQYLASNDSLIKELAQCDTQITPNCLRALYQFPVNNESNPDNSYGIVEYTPQAYLPADLDLFFANFSVDQIGNRPIFDSIDGGVLQTEVESFNYNGESDLDLEYAMALVYPQNVTLYQVGDLVEGASFNNFLDAIDGSYCTYEGGDDPDYDAVYPDEARGGFDGPENCGGFPAAKVISTSYSYNEADLTPAYERRQCDEYMKLGLMGTTILYSSGDYGVAGNGGQCIDPVTGNFTNGTYGKFNPAFPSTCPYVTSVGATQVKNNTDITKALASGTQPEEACETVIYSGGGFSNVFPLPSYQADAVQSFFENHPPPYGADRFNNSQQTRGHPDISANGANYVVAIDGTFALVYGTSASSPTLGSILTLINQARLDAGKASIGFINPVAYANPDAFNDITEGGNQGCGTPGFEATTGWDPVTGLGTPNYPKLLDVFLALD